MICLLNVRKKSIKSISAEVVNFILLGRLMLIVGGSFQSKVEEEMAYFFFLFTGKGLEPSSASVAFFIYFKEGIVVYPL